jgi:WD40 repeat protein
MLQALISVLLDTGGLSAGSGVAEAEALWAAVRREAPRMQTPFDAASWAGRFVQRPILTTAEPATSQAFQAAEATPADETERRLDWGEAPDTVGFVGRTDELAALHGWVLDERCRLVALLGMGGIGKTSMAAKLAQDVAPDFERVYWRSLRDAPPIREWLSGAIGLVSNQQLVPPASDSEGLVALLQLMRTHRCLLVLDNFETLFEPGQREGRYRARLAAYGRLLRAAAEAVHQSCVVLTSREAPPELAAFAPSAVRAFQLGGLGVDEARVLLAPKLLSGTGLHWAQLTARLAGNGLALKLVSETISELFGGDIGAYLDGAGSETVFGGIRRLLEEQLERTSRLEQDLLNVLAVEREPVTVAELLSSMGRQFGRGVLLETVEGLRRRSLIERAELPGAAAFTLQSVVLEYLTGRLVETLSDEIQRGQPMLLVTLPIIRAQAKEYVREAQERLIGQPILQQLEKRYGADATEKQLIGLLGTWRSTPLDQQGYGPGNVVNLLRLTRGKLRGLDLSRLAIRQGYLAEVDAQDASLVDAYLADTVLAEAFDFPCSVALSGDGALLAAGTSTGQVWVWRTADRTPLWAVQAHNGGVWRVAISAHGHLLASVGADGLVAVWSLAGIGDRKDPELGMQAAKPAHAVAVLRGHTGAVWCVALSGDGGVVASGGADGTVRLWSLAAANDRPDARLGMLEASTGQALAILPAHSGGVWGVALSDDGQLVASGGADGRVRLWSLADLGDPRPAQEVNPGRALATMESHPGGVWGVALSADGELLATGGADGTVRLWSLASLGDRRDTMLGMQETSIVSPMATLEGHTSGVWRVALSSDGQLLISAGADGTVRLWEPGTGRLVAILQGHTHAGAIWGLALSADGTLLASGGAEGALRLWEASTGRPLAILRGRTGAVWGVAMSADGELLASGGADGAVRVWSLTGATRRTVVAPTASRDTPEPGGVLGTPRAGTGRPLANLRGHTGVVRSVALCADAHLVASGGEDATVRLWSLNSTGAQRDDRLGKQHVGTRPPLAELRGHTGVVRSVALSGDGRRVVSGSDDNTVRVWDSSTGRAVSTFHGHTGVVWSVALSADGHLVASSGEDGTVRLWDTASGHALATLRDHTDGIRSVALSSDGHLLASGGGDGILQVWDAISRQLVTTLQAHAGAVGGLALSADGHLLASGGDDGKVRLWSLARVYGSRGSTFGTQATGIWRPLATLQGHASAVLGLALSADGHLVASGSLDGTVKLWESSGGACLRTFRTERHYERLDITGLSGITAAQHAALLALGAVEQQDQAAKPGLTLPLESAREDLSW